MFLGDWQCLRPVPVGGSVVCGCQILINVLVEEPCLLQDVDVRLRMFARV